jgi:transketolase
MNFNDKNLASLRQAFADTLLELAKIDPNLYVVSAGLRPSLFLDNFAIRYKSRFIECGVAENNAAGIAAGLAKSGKNVFLCTYACFSPGLNWQTIKQSICLNNLPVKIIGSHAGLLTGELGASHQMLEDIALTRTLPNLEVFAPLDSVETVKITKVLAKSNTPCYLRLTRPVSPIIFPQNLPFTIGKSHLLHFGESVTILGYGPILSQVFSLDVDKLSLEIINCSSLKPLDEDTILKSVKKTGRCLVIEDHQQNGGLGEAIAALILKNNLKCRFAQLAVSNSFGQSALDPFDLYRLHGLSPVNIAATIKKLCHP